MTRSWILVSRFIILLGLALVASACSILRFEEAYVPDDKGLYSYDAKDKKLQRLDGNQEWEQKSWAKRSSLNPDTQFVIANPALVEHKQPLQDTIHLRKVAWLRSEITADGTIVPVQGSRWVDTDVKDLQVPLRFQSVKAHSDIVRVIPLHPLDPGLYSLQLHSNRTRVNARLGVQWPSVNKQAYSAATCVDRYADAEPRFRHCAEQGEFLATKGLKLFLVSPDTQSTASGVSMEIKGVIVNDSGRQRTIPTLEAQLLTQQNEVIKSWRFLPQTSRLGPGESLHFRTQVHSPPPDANRVRVRFVTGNSED